MGTAMAVLGLRVDRNQLFEKCKLPGCEHHHDSKFCPSCGAEAFHEVDKLKSFVVEKPDEFPPYVVGEYSVMLFEANEDNFVIILRGAVVTEDTLSSDHISVMGRGAELGAFQAAMEKVGLWDPNVFGVWVAYRH
jgi:hypothetical protein